MIGICEVSMSEDKGEKTTWCFIDHHRQHNHHYQSVEIICCHYIEQNILYVRRLILVFDRNKWDHFYFLFVNKHPTEKETKQQLSTEKRVSSQTDETVELLCKSHWKMNQWFHLCFSNWCISLMKKHYWMNQFDRTFHHKIHSSRYKDVTRRHDDHQNWCEYWNVFKIKVSVTMINKWLTSMHVVDSFE